MTERSMWRLAAAGVVCAMVLLAMVMVA